MRTPLVCALFVCASLTRADVSLAPLFQDHAILQRDQSLPVWGTARAGETVSVTFAGQHVATTAAEDGRWSVVFAPIPANAVGTTMTVSGDNTVTLTDLLIGDVWLCGGQSNMELPLRMVNDAEAEAAHATYPLIRHIKIERTIAATPLSTASGSWTTCTPETAPHYTAIGYFFARDLQREIGVPIGLINSNWGGTPVEAWLPTKANSDLNVEVLAASHQAKSNAGIYDNLKRYSDQLAAWQTNRATAEREGRPFDTKAPSHPWVPGPSNTSYVLNHGMIAPLAPYAMRGVIWYQGEANADQPETYRDLFSALILAWRDQFKQPDLPFYWVQLANWNAGDPAGDGWARLREAQTQTLTVPHTGQAVIIDIGDPEDIHPRNKQDVGDRLARLALARTYGRTDVIDSGPTFAHAAIDRSTVTITLDHAEALHTTDGAAPLGFELAGADRQFHPAIAQLLAGRVTLTAAAVPSPIYVRYAWHNQPDINLVNSENLPTAPFRTDTDSP